MFNEAAVLGEMIHEAPIQCSVVGGMARPFTIVFIILILAWKKCVLEVMVNCILNIVLYFIDSESH